MPKKRQGVYIKVFVKKTGAKETQVPTHIEGNTIFVRLKASPRRGKANKELLRELSNLFDIPKRYITLVRGLRSRKKTVFLETDPKIVENKIKKLKNRSF